MPKNWNIRAIRGKPQYEEGFLAYLDVLGFKNLMDKYARENPRKLLKLFGKIDDAVQHPQISGLTQSYLSDSILIWCTHPFSISLMLDVCNVLQDELLLEGCLVRGAIVSGKHYRGYVEQLNIATGERDGKAAEILLSPALVKAHLIEKNLRDPVIIVEGAVLNAANAIFKSVLRRRQPSMRKFSSTKLYELPGCLQSLRFKTLQTGASLTERPDKSWQRYPDVLKEIAALRRIRKHIVQGIGNENPRISRKWKHVRRMFNRQIRPMIKNWDGMRTVPLIGMK